MSESNGQPDLKRFETGAVRSRDADGERYDLITPVGLEGVARIYAEGARKYGEHLWEHGMPISDLVNHALRHWRLYASGDRSEDHLSKCIWGFMAAKHSEVCWPHLNSDLRRKVGDQACVPPVVDDETAAGWARFRAQMDGLRRGDHDGGNGVDRMVVPEPEESRVVAYPPPRAATKYCFLAREELRGSLLAYRSDLQFEGHEVVTRWLDNPRDGDLISLDLQSCDVILAIPDRDHAVNLEFARSFGKPIVLVGPCPDDFPRLGTAERWFPSWASFIQALAGERARSASAS